MQRPGEPGAARFGPPEGCVDHRPHRYRSFMIEEILTEPPGPKGAAPAAAAAAAGELLKFGVQALLAARPFHSHLGTCSGLGLTGGWESSKGLPRIPPPSLCSSSYLGYRPHARLFTHFNWGVEGAGNGLRRNQALCPQARPEESLSSASGRLRLFQSVSRPGPGTGARISIRRNTSQPIALDQNDFSPGKSKFRDRGLTGHGSSCPDL